MTPFDKIAQAAVNVTLTIGALVALYVAVYY